MKHKTRAFWFTLAAALMFVVPSAFAADNVGSLAAGPVQVGLGTQPVAVDIDNDAVLRGVGFQYRLDLGTAATADIIAVTVNAAELGQRRLSAVANTGFVYMAGRNGVDDLAAGAHAGALTFDVALTGNNGDQALLIIEGVAPWPAGPIFVDAVAGRNVIQADTIVIELLLGITPTIYAVCGANTYEGGGVAWEVEATANVGNFVSLDLLSIAKDGFPAVPANDPVLTGRALVDAPDADSAIFYWAPAAGEAGSWEFCFIAYNDGGDSGIACQTVTVGVPGADHAVWLPQHIEYSDGLGPFAKDLVVQTTTAFDSTFAMTLPFELLSASGGAYLAANLVDPGDGTGDAEFPPAFSVFESRSTNFFTNDGPTTDSVLGGLVDFGGAALDPGTYDAITLHTSLLDVEGILQIVTAESPGFPPANMLSWNGPSSAVVTPTYAEGCYPITIVRNICPTSITCPVASVGPVVFGTPVSISGFGYLDPDGSPGPYTFSVVSTEKDGLPATPVNAPTFTGDTFDWTPDGASQADVGIWEFCVTVDDGSGSCAGLLTCCFTVEVISRAPFFFCFEEAEALSNAEVEVCINGLNTAPVPLAGGFDLLFDYDCTMLTLLDITAGDELAAHGWEYFTYRIVSTNPCKVRIVAIADMNNSNVHPDDENPDGCIAKLRFKTTNDRTLACQKAFLRFEWLDCGDNTVSDRSGDTLFIVGGVDAGPPWIYDPMADADFYHQYPDPWGWGATVTDSNGCPGTQKQAIEEFIYFCNGSIRIICPPEIDDRGDMNLNGLAYEIADAVLYSRYFIIGTGALDPIYFEAQIAASDVNADGVPLTVADLVYMIRVITGDAIPIAEGGVGPKIAVGELDVISAQQGANVTVKSVSDQDLGAALFVFKYDNTEITEVSVAGRASGMDIDYQAEAGELRVLVYNISDRAKIEAGTGEILNVTTSGRGSVELVSVEAATFMGGALKANVSSQVLPTEYALRQNYPNPFNPTTSMALDLPEASDYSLTIYNITGQVVRTFSGHAEAGTLKLTWNGRDDRGAQVASGVYFYRAQAAEYTATKKMVLMK